MRRRTKQIRLGYGRRRRAPATRGIIPVIGPAGPILPVLQAILRIIGDTRSTCILQIEKAAFSALHNEPSAPEALAPAEERRSFGAVQPDCLKNCLTSPGVL